MSTGLLLAFVAACGAGDTPLTLEDGGRFHFPDDFRPVRVAALDSTLAVLSAQSGAIAVVRENGIELIRAAGLELPVGLRFSLAGNCLVEVMDAGRGLVVGFGTDGQLCETSIPEPPPGVLQAAPAPNGWFVLAVYGEDLELYRFHQGTWQYIFGMSLRGRSAMDYYLSNRGSDAVLSTGKKPFDMIVLDTAGKVLLWRTGWPETRYNGARGAQHHAFPPLFVGDQIVQTVADLSDDSYMIAVGRGGAKPILKALPAPTVFVAYLADGHRIVAFRNLTGRSEAVFYRVRREQSDPLQFATGG